MFTNLVTGIAPVYLPQSPRGFVPYHMCKQGMPGFVHMQEKNVAYDNTSHVGIEHHNMTQQVYAGECLEPLPRGRLLWGRKGENVANLIYFPIFRNSILG